MNKTSCISAVLIMAALFLDISCAPVYRPTVLNAPMFRSQGQIKLSGHSSMAGYEVQGAAAVSDHIGVVVNSVVAANSSAEEEQNGETVKIKNKTRQLEGGLGVYHAFRSGVVTELYAGYGYAYSRTLSDEGPSPDVVEATYHRFYAQPALGFVDDYFEVGLAVRVLHLNAFEYHDYSNGDTDPHSGTFVEPVIFMRVGFRQLKLEGQLGASIIRSGDIDYIPLIASVGILYSFSL
ncbi:MAG TPA: hypothetical protein PK253_08585 [Spirochaetota bacterium]|nr:hypothetical protein [Spirochaetota bacterium]HPQ53297.1 hypothetical protein [Spirochaetota bacterium]